MSITPTTFRKFNASTTGTSRASACWCRGCDMQLLILSQTLRLGHISSSTCSVQYTSWNPSFCLQTVGQLSKETNDSSHQKNAIESICDRGIMTETRVGFMVKLTFIYEYQSGWSERNSGKDLSHMYYHWVWTMTLTKVSVGLGITWADFEPQNQMGSIIIIVQTLYKHIFEILRTSVVIEYQNARTYILALDYSDDLPH